VPAQGLDVVQQRGHVVAGQRAARQAAAATPLVIGDPPHRQAVPPLQAGQAGAPTRATVQHQHRHAVRIPALAPGHPRLMRQIQRLPRQAVQTGWLAHGLG